MNKDFKGYPYFINTIFKLVNGSRFRVKAIVPKLLRAFMQFKSIVIT
jgi:hypothetical protein